MEESKKCLLNLRNALPRGTSVTINNNITVIVFLSYSVVLYKQGVSKLLEKLLCCDRGTEIAFSGFTEEEYL